MNINCFILLCVAYYIPAINAIHESEIEFLWKAIKNIKVEKDYIELADLTAYYKEGKGHFSEVIRDFGNPCKTSEGEREPHKKMYYEGFVRAFKRGVIPRWAFSVMRDKFQQVASRGLKNYGLQIAPTDIEQCDEKNEYSEKELDNIMKQFGCELKEGEPPRLDFFGFLKAVNTDHIPVLDLNVRLCKLKRVEDSKPRNVIEKPELDFLWNAIKNIIVEKDYVDSSDLVEYYKEGSHFSDVTRLFGNPCTNDGGEPDMHIDYDGFIRAVEEGGIPRWSFDVIRKKYQQIASVGSHGRQIFIDDIKKYDKEKKFTPQQVDDIMKQFGRRSKGEQPRLSFFGFLRAVGTNKLPVLELNDRLCKLECVEDGKIKNKKTP